MSVTQLDIFTHYIFVSSFYKCNFKELNYLYSWSSLDVSSKFQFFLHYYTFTDEMRSSGLTD